MRIFDSAAVERILKAMADSDNIKIMTGVQKEPRSAQSISAETGIPQSTVYRKLDELKEAGLTMTDHFTINAGKKVDYVTVTFSELKIGMEDGKVRIDIVPSDENANLKWLGLFRGQ